MSTLNVTNVKAADGTSGLSIANTTGIVTLSKSIGFMAAIGASSQTSLPTSTYKKIELVSTHPRGFDPQSGWSNTDYYYTIPSGMGGYWLLSAHIEMSVLSPATRCIISTTATTDQSGSNFLFYGHSGDHTTNTNNGGGSCSGIANLSAGTIIKMEGYHAYGSTQTVAGHDTYGRTYLSGWRLG